MTLSKSILAVASLALSLGAGICAAEAATDWTNSGMYNGYGMGSQNSPSNYSMRDANGNLTMVNGQVTPSSFSSNSGAQNASAGVGTQGAGAAYGQASAIGNSLNVVVVGSHNTTIIDAQQTNNGNQTASVKINRN
jgi:holdfast attachment protein HfaA